MQDKIVESVRQDLLERSERGIVKYGVTLCGSGLSLRDFLQHSYEETLDNANYLKAAIQKIDDEAKVQVAKACNKEKSNECCQESCLFGCTEFLNNNE